MIAIESAVFIFSSSSELSSGAGSTIKTSLRDASGDSRDAEQAVNEDTPGITSIEHSFFKRLIDT